jgi:Xaa-Pro aminopeptidase
MGMPSTSFPRRLATLGLGWLLLAPALRGQAAYRYQDDFPAEELKARRTRVLDAIGEQAFAVLQGAPAAPGFVPFRQTNEFYYLTGLEVPHAYLVLDGRTRQATLYLPHRDERRERGEGRMLAAEDADDLKRMTGVDAVAGVEQMGRQLYGLAMRQPPPAVFTPWSPAEGAAQSRDELLIGYGSLVSDPWDGRPSREGQFLHLFRTRYPQFVPRDLTPILDAMRIVKSPREVALVGQASRLAGLALVEAMRSTRPGVMEYELDAVARYVFFVNGARGEGYRPITAGGANAFYGHYHRNDQPLRDGDLVLMDYAPDYRYYTSDVARMWPVNGRFSPAQRALYGFVVDYAQALLKRIRLGVTADAVMDEAAKEMEGAVARTRFASAVHEKAAREMLRFRGHLSHPVGLAVHDVGDYRRRPLQPGDVFSVDPQMWVNEERLYVRMEDVVAVTETGVVNFTEFVPDTPEEIEVVVGRDGLRQARPPAPR